MKEIISTEKAPAAIGPYSQAVKAGNLLFISGQIPVDPATGEVVEATIQAQTAQSLTNLKAILAHGGRDDGPCGEDHSVSQRYGKLCGDEPGI